MLKEGTDTLSRDRYAQYDKQNTGDRPAAEVDERHLEAEYRREDHFGKMQRRYWLMKKYCRKGKR